MQRLYTVATWMEKISDDGHIKRIILIGLFFLYEVSHISLASVFGSLIMTRKMLQLFVFSSFDILGSKHSFELKFSGYSTYQ